MDFGSCLIRESVRFGGKSILLSKVYEGLKPSTFARKGFPYLDPPIVALGRETLTRAPTTGF